MTESGLPPVVSGSPADAGTCLLALHGELMDGQALAALFKFGSDRSFRRNASNGTLPVSVCRVPGRRGWFARTRDVGKWLSSTPIPPRPRGLSV